MAHSLLSPSSAHRWLACTPSALWEQDFPDTAGEAAAEGTVAHAVAEDHLKKWLAGKKQITAAKLKKDPRYAPVMEEHVQTYVSYVQKVYMDHSGEDPYVYVEKHIDYSKYAPGGFGTSDCIILSDNHIDVFDFKYGRTVLVEAKENPQMMIYALGALIAYDFFDDIQDVTMHIVQPRMGNISTYYMRKDDLMSWVRRTLVPAAQLAAKGEGERVAGKHCFFCKCKHRCPEYASLVSDEVTNTRYDETGRQKQPGELSDSEIALILEQAPALISWLNGVKDYALSEALSGKEFPGWKIVEGRSSRKIKDEAKAVQTLKEAGYADSDILELKGITALTKLMGNDTLEATLGDQIAKSKGKPTLVPVDDPRDMYTSFEPVKE